MSINDYQTLANEMMREDDERNSLFEAMENMKHGKYTLPENLIKDRPWIRTVIDISPYSSIKTGTNILSGLEPRIKWNPIFSNAETKAKANELEHIMKLWLMGSSRRRKTMIVDDMVDSALTYDMIACEVVDNRVQKKLGKGSWETVYPFTTIVRCPKDVHARYSDTGLEEVLYVTDWKMRNLLSYWGDLAKSVRGLEDADNYNQTVTVYDYQSRDKRVVWAETMDREKREFILDEENKKGFINWAIRVGGSVIESEPKYQVNPINSILHHTRIWETHNIVESLNVSEIIARAAAPRGIKAGPNPDSIEHDYGDPSNDVVVPTGNTYTPLPPPQMDQGLPVISDRLSSEIQRATLPRLLQDGNIAANTQFATMNMAMQTALGTLKPYRCLAEDTLADIFMIMVKLAKVNGEVIEMTGQGKEYGGKQISFIPDEVEDNPDISVELTPDIPTDRQSRINGASMAMQNLNYSNERALEDIGVTDPQKEIEQSIREKLTMAKVAAKIKEIQAEVDLKIQQAQMQMQLEMQQAVQQQQAQMQQQQMEAQQNMMGQSDNMQGEGWNPNGGGLPPQMANPGMTREGVTGMTQGGQDAGGF